jgi:hypothetical protein
VSNYEKNYYVTTEVMQSTESLLNVAFNSSLQKYGGDIAVGSMTISSNLMQISFTNHPKLLSN